MTDSSRSRPAGSTTAANDSVVIPGRWRTLGMISAPLWADNNESTILSTLAPVIIKALSLPTSAVGVLISISKAISIFFGPLWAFLARKIGRKAALVVSTFGVGLFTAGAGTSQGYVQLTIWWVGASMFAAAALPIVTEITADLFDEKSRGRANGWTWGAISLVGAILGPFIGQLSGIPDGWRYGYYGAGAINILVALIVLLYFKDPGVGASEPSLVGLSAEQRAENSKLTWPKVSQLFKIPTFVLMLFQRLISGHLLIGTFGVLFLVQTYGFNTATAAIVSLPFGIGYMGGTLVGGVIVDALQSRWPNVARVAVLQGAQLGFGVFALLGTQINWGAIGIFAVFWGLMGFMQGINPGVNRPIVSAVVPPELRGAAFALMLSVFEAIAFIAYNLIAGFLADAVGLKVVMLWIPGILMLINAAYVTLLYRTYPRDVARQREVLAREAVEAQA